MFAPIAQAGAFFNPYQASSSYLPLAAPTPLPTPSFYSSAPTAVPLPLAAPTPAPAQYDYSNSNVIANPYSADMYRYPNSSKNFPSYKYEEITFELPQDYYSNNQPTTYTVRDYSSSNVAGNSTSTASTSNGGNQSTPAQNGSHQSRPPSTRPLSRNQARSMTPFGSVAMAAAPQQGGNEAQRSFTPNPFHLQSTAPTPLPDASLRKMRKSRLQSRFQNSTPTIMNCYQHQPDSFTSASNLNMNGRAKTPANQGGQYSIQQSEYYMNAYSAQAAANQGQQNNGSQTPAPNGHVANEYLSKPPIYYNTFNSINNANNVQNNANTNKNMMGYNSGRCSVVMDPLNPPKIQQRAPSALTLNNGQVQQMQQQQAPQPQPRQQQQQQQQQQQGYDNSSADQISYFDSPVTPTPSIYNPNLKTSDSGRLSRRQKATPSTVHFASPLVTPIPYALDGSVRYDVKENIDPMLDAECKRHRMLKETRSHSTIPTYRPQPLTPVNYSFETSRGISDSKMKKYRPNTPGSMTLHRDGLMADPSQLLNMQQQQQLQQQHQSRKMCTPGGITATTPTPLHMLMMTNNQTPHPHGHHHHHHRHHHHSHHHRSHNGVNNNTPTYPHSQSSTATNNGLSNQNGNSNSNFIRLCYLKPNSNEFECKNIQIRDDGSGGGVGNSGGNGGGGNEYGANFGCSLEDLKKKKKMKFLGVFKETPSSASYDTMDSWITNTRPDSRLKYQDNDPKKRVNIAISNPAINNSHHGGNNASNNNMYMNHQVKFSPPQKSDSIINDYGGGGQSVDSNDSSFGFDEFGGGGVTSADEAVTIMPMNGYSTGNASSKKLDLLSGLKPSNSREKLYKLIKDANGLVLLKEIS